MTEWRSSFGQAARQPHDLIIDRAHGRDRFDRSMVRSRAIPRGMANSVTGHPFATFATRIPIRHRAEGHEDILDGLLEDFCERQFIGHACAHHTRRGG